MALTVTCPAFADGKPVPREFTCDGADRSPPLSVSGLPAGTAAIALVLDDPDAPRGTWTHWTFWDLPPRHAALPAGADVRALGATEGTTSARTAGYHGPCPPSGTHRYFVRVYALSRPLGLPAGASAAQVQAALKGSVLAQAETMGTCSRP